MDNKVFAAMSRFGVVSHDIDPWQRNLFGLTGEVKDSFLWPHIASSTLKVLADSPQEIPEHIRQQLQAHLEDCELCHSRLAGYSQHRQCEGAIKLLPSDVQCIAMGGEIEIRFVEEGDRFCSRARWYIYHLGISDGIWQVDLKYDPAKEKLAASLILPEVVGDWTSLELSLINYDLDHIGNSYLIFDKTNMEIEIDFKAEGGGSWQLELYLYGRYPEWISRVYNTCERNILPLTGSSNQIEIQFCEDAIDQEVADFLSVIFYDHMGRPVIFEPEDQIIGAGRLLTPWGSEIGRIKTVSYDNQEGKLFIELDYLLTSGYILNIEMDPETEVEDPIYHYCYPQIWVE